MIHDTSTDRKARGAFFTPPEIARFIAEWAIRDRANRIFEPSCGDAEFLLAAGNRLRELGSGGTLLDSLQGVEIHEPSAEQALRRLKEVDLEADIEVGDFFDIETPRRYDAVIGNPPYVRYQDFSGKARTKALEAALRQGVRLSGLASSWAAFTVHAADFVAPEGRLGLVLPAELLSVKYAGKVRRFLLERFARVRLLMFEELVFPGVQEEVVLLLAEGTGPAPNFEVYQARDLSELGGVDASSWTSYSPRQGEKWLTALLPPETIALYQRLQSDGLFVPLAEWGSPYLGIVTGSNKFFTLSKDESEAWGIGKDDLLRISPPGSRHLRSLSFTPEDWTGHAEAGDPVFLFFPSEDDPSNESKAYIESGEAEGIHQGYKCRNRSPWWRVPLVDRPDFLLTYMARDWPRLLQNAAGVYHLNSLYGVRLHEGCTKGASGLLPVVSLSSLTALGAELVGRAYGGGLLKLEPREADKLPMPSPRLLEGVASELEDLAPEIDRLLRDGELEAARHSVDDVVLRKAASLSSRQIDQLRGARQLLFGRRTTRAKT